MYIMILSFKICLCFFNVVRKYLGLVSITDMQTSPPPTPPFINGHKFMKDAQCAETNEKSIFRFLRFLFFELWLISFTIFQCFYWPNMVKILKIFGNKKKLPFFVPEDVLKRIYNYFIVPWFLVLGIWTILYSKFLVNWTLCELDTETLASDTRLPVG